MRERKHIPKLTAGELFEYAVKLLSGRACSSAEIASKLRRKAEREGDVSSVIERLKELKYLDDARFAEGFASARIENNGFGRMRVLSDLRSRRVSQKIADHAVANAFDGRDEDAMIDAYIEKRLPGLATIKSAVGGTDRAAADRKLASAYRRLRRAGFRSGAILAALKRLGAPADIEEPAEDENEQA